MLKTFLAVILALMLVFGISGMASACKPDIDCGVSCSSRINLCKSIRGCVRVKVGASVEVSPLGDKNVNDICQTGYDNTLGDVVQYGLGNYSEVTQEGSYQEVGDIYQDTWGGGHGYNVSVVVQWTGDSNRVGNITQLTLYGGYNVSSVVQNGSLNWVGDIYQSSS